MSELRLTKEDVQGIFTILPTPATEDGDDPTADFTVDREETRRAARALIDDGVDGIMINGTYGEAATLTREEWRTFTSDVIDAVDGDVPVVAGPTTTGTRTTIERAKYARDEGADGLLLGRPMWARCSPETTVEFYRHVAEAVPEMGIVVYDNPGAFKGRLNVPVWEELIEIPQIVAAKYSGGMGAIFREVFRTVQDDIRFLPIDRDWYVAHTWFPEEAKACWSPASICGPKPIVMLRDAILSGDYRTASWLTNRMTETYQEFYPEGEYKKLFRMYNVPLEKHRFNGAGYIHAGPSRPPYHVIPEEYAEGARETGRRWQAFIDELETMDEIPPADWGRPEA